MKKYSVVFMILFTLVLSACGNDDADKEKRLDEVDDKKVAEVSSNEGEESKKSLKLQVLKGDEENGVTVENNLLYSELDKVVQQNQELGPEDDFAVFIADVYENDEGDAKIILLGINRLPVAIKNFSFTFTLGSTDGDYIWERQPVEMKEEIAGILQQNSALPIALSITKEQNETLKNIEKGKSVMTIDGFIYEEVK